MGYQPADLLKSLLPKRWVVDVNTEWLEQRFRRVRATGLEQGEILWNECFPFVFVHSIEREDQKLAEDVAVAIKTRMDEVRDIRPAPAIAVGQIDGVAVVFFV